MAPRFSSRFSAVVLFAAICWVQRAFLSPRLGYASPRGASFGSASVVPQIRQALEESGTLRQWLESAAALSQACSLELEEAEGILAKSAGWSTWLAVNRAAYLKPEDPNAQETLEALKYFRDGPLKLTSEQLRDVLRASPKALSKPQAAYQAARQTAPEEFQSPEAFRELVLRCPMVLELSFNCGHSCAAACNRCWCPAMNRIKQTVAGR
ncbi:unnamed protein product [Cladocopium goreaui]|uniref:Ubiquitinyl hydrolase 1 n=1 Tax=Cladocopium goreaui TaxID=2562237 RepID=A0A9P1DRZ2_9DINO|nr:unnamed protein product [Cladocopium goreaui]